MEKNNFKTVKLGKGVMEIYDFGAVKLHAYKTNDLITDECFLLEKGGKMFMVEAPCFFDNIKELEAYIKGLSVEFVGTVIAYHGAGATFMKGAPVYSTRHADDYNHNGGGAALVKNFTAAFGDAFDSSIYATTDFIEGETLNLAGIDMRIVATQEAFNIEFPEINVVYTHMMGHDVHSIVAGSKHADAIIAQLTDYIDRGEGDEEYRPQEREPGGIQERHEAGIYELLWRKIPGHDGGNVLQIDQGACERRQQLLNCGL